MQVPQQPIPSCRLRNLLRRYFGISLLLLCGSSLFAKGPEPPLRIPLEPLGFQPLMTQFLLAGSSLFTVNYVDDHHLLLTFTVRRLLSRLPDEPEEDQDRTVDALLLELPTGRVLARTSWRLHDHAQYLWDLGHGRFLLRVRDRLTTIAPLINLPAGEPFHEHPFLVTEGRRVAALLLSPDANLLVVESIKRTPPVARPKTLLFGSTPPAPEETSVPNSVQFNFYRLSAPDDKSEEIKPRFAGVVRSSSAGSIATTAAGYLAVIDQGRQHWAFDFNSYAGKTSELSPFDSTCRPSPVLVSRSEFIAFGCHGGSTRQLLGGFNMRGDEMWEQNLYGDYLAPSLAFAPSSGRFALSRILVRTSVVPDQPLVSEELNGQSVVVYQTGSGKQVLHAECSPVERAGQNFSLSPSGLGLAVIHADAIEVYGLPPLTTKEQADVKVAEAAAPEETEAPVHFEAMKRLSPGIAAESEGEGASAAMDNNVSPVATPPPQAAAAMASTPAGDPGVGQPRKPPTLYTLPGDPVQSPSANQPK